MKHHYFIKFTHPRASASGDGEGAGTDAEMREYIDKKPMLIRWAVYLALFLAVLILGVYGPGYDASVFIYREF